MLIRADAIEAAGLADLIAHAPPAALAALGLVAVPLEGALQIHASTPITLFNRVIGLGTIGPARADLVDAAIAGARAAGRDKIWIHVGSPARAVLEPLLGARGFAPPARAAWAKMARGTEPPPAIATDLAIVEIGADRAGDFGRVMAEAFAMPPPMVAMMASALGRPRWRGYGALDGGELVAVGAVFIDGDSAWLGMGGTLPSHRRRGAQGALMARRIADAIAAGCTAIMTETGEPIGDEPNPSLANMLRCGFTRVDVRANWELRL